ESVHHTKCYRATPFYDRLFKDGSIPVRQTTRAGSLVENIGTYLRQRLPDYMVPAAYVSLPALPLTPTGKVVRNALPAPDLARLGLGRDMVAPHDLVELQIAQEWEALLHVHPVGVTDNFFDLGGHSLLAVRLLTRIRQMFGQNIPLATLFQSATIEHLASYLRRTHASIPRSAVVGIQTEGTRRPLFCAHPVSGSVLSYVELARQLGPDQPFYGLQAPGLDGECKPFVVIEDLAAHYIDALRAIQPDGPYL